MRPFSYPAIHNFRLYLGGELTLAFTLGCLIEATLQLGKLRFCRQQEQRVGHPDRDLAVAHRLDQLWDRPAFYAPDTFSFGCARQG
jgi:hypothetical protein